MDKGQLTRAIFTDLSKAFESTMKTNLILPTKFWYVRNPRTNRHAQNFKRHLYQNIKFQNQKTST